MTKYLPHSHLQSKSDNRGASLVTVIIITALVLVMVTVLLSMVLLNYFMKNQNEKSQENFYNAETAMEEIRLGIVTEVSQASAVAYTEVLTNYNDLTLQEKEETFQKVFFSGIQKRLQKTENKTLYNCDLLKSFLKDENALLRTTDDGVTNAMDDKTLEAGERCLVLQNVKVSYRDKEDNYTEIESDISIFYPQIDFSNASSLNNILCYALIAGEDATLTKEKQSVVVQNAKTKISGNVYLGTGVTAVTNQGSLYLQPSGNAKSYVIGGDVLLKQGSVHLSDMEMWVKNILVSQNSDFTSKGADTYLQNDLVLSGNGSTASMEGGLYAFGNPEAIRNSTVYQDNVTNKNGENVRQQLEANEADFSSSIILNGGKNTKLDLSGLNHLMIAGTSYINTQKSSHAVVSGSKNHSIETGQSVMTTSDQRAYLIPGELIRKGSENGGANPMTAQMYQELKAEIMAEKGYSEESQILPDDFIDFTSVCAELGGSLNDVGVKDYDVSAIQVSGVGSMYYFFMKFENQTARNAFVKKYYNQQKQYSKLQENLSDYAGGDVKLPTDSGNSLSFYLQGNALATNGSHLLVQDTMQREQESILEREVTLTDSYAGLMVNLEQNYQLLNQTQKRNALFDNLFDTKSISGADKYFSSATLEGAVVTAGDIKVSQAKSNLQKKSEKGASLNLIIAKGNVVLDEDFEGLIVCGGSITIDENCKEIKQNAKKASMAFFQSSSEDGERPADYLSDDVGWYMIGGTVKNQETKKQAESIRFLDYVTYDNWEKH